MSARQIKSYEIPSPSRGGVVWGSVFLWMLPALLMLTLIGCARGVTYVIDVSYSPQIKDLSHDKTEPVRIAVIPFEDSRENKRGIGTRTRLMGRIDEFEARPYPAAAAITDTLVSALRIKGYNPVVVTGGKDYAGITEGTSIQMVLSGTVEELWAEAISKPAHTSINTKVKIKVNIYSVNDKTIRTLTVQSQSAPQVVFFSPGILQHAVNDTLTDAINKLLATPL
ncbi:MAG: hypothetical protein IT392_09785 [Nitrospirae bacterium]|nr:hypothetical protein [Nitrospirota bacterium]